MVINNDPKFLVVGGGLGGALMAAYLGKAGYDADVCEMRGDLRGGNISGGRSINLALSHRGICALERIGVDADVLAESVPMRGRMMHARSGRLTFQPYGEDDAQSIKSVSRGGLNCILLDAAERYDSVRLHFNRKCTDYDVDSGTAAFVDSTTGEQTTVSDRIVIGADGAFSAVRRPLLRRDRFSFSQSYLEHGFKELRIPPAASGGFRMEQNALHIWPRRSFMMIALPNIDGSYTCTIFWPLDGPLSFNALQTQDDVLAYFNREFPDAVPLMPTLTEDFMNNPTGTLATFRCAPWVIEDKMVLIGDAAHAVVPFYGQGMNASFEDVLVLCECMEKHKPDWRRAFSEYYRLRKNNVDTLADMAINNFVEMRDHTGSKWFLLKKKKEQWLHKLLGDWYVPLYSMATFTRMPYVDAVERAKRQDRNVFLAAISGIILVILLLVVALR